VSPRSGPPSQGPDEGCPTDAVLAPRLPRCLASLCQRWVEQPPLVGLPCLLPLAHRGSDRSWRGGRGRGLPTSWSRSRPLRARPRGRSHPLAHPRTAHNRSTIGWPFVARQDCTEQPAGVPSLAHSSATYFAASSTAAGPRADARTVVVRSVAGPRGAAARAVAPSAAARSSRAYHPRRPIGAHPPRAA